MLELIRRHKSIVIYGVVIIMVLIISLGIFVTHSHHEQKTAYIKDIIDCYAKYDLILIKHPLPDRAEYAMLGEEPETFRFDNDDYGKVLIYQFDSIYDRVQATKWRIEDFDHDFSKSIAIYGVKEYLILYIYEYGSPWLSSDMTLTSRLRQVEFELNNAAEVVLYGESENWQCSAISAYYEYSYETVDGEIETKSKGNITGQLQYLGEDKNDVTTICVDLLATRTQDSGHVHETGSIVSDKTGVFNFRLPAFFGAKDLDTLDITVEWNGKSEFLSVLPLENI